jgi:hypothetical protein
VSDTPHRRGAGVGMRLRSAVAAMAIGSAGSHRAPCHNPACGGTLTIERVPFNGELVESCNRCRFRGPVRRTYPAPSAEVVASASAAAAEIPPAGKYGGDVCGCGDAKKPNALRCPPCAATTRRLRATARDRASGHASR